MQLMTDYLAGKITTLEFMDKVERIKNGLLIL